MPVAACQIVVETVAAEALHGFRCAQDRTANCLFRPGCRLEQIKCLVFRSIVGCTDLLQDHVLLAHELFGLKGRVLQNVRQYIHRERRSSARIRA